MCILHETISFQLSFLSFMYTRIGQVRCRFPHIVRFLCLWMCIGSVNMSELTRPLTVRFPSRGFSRLEHSEVLESLEDSMEPTAIKAIQITETTCFITLDSDEVKQKLLLDGINVRGTFNSITDVDRVITNVTIKDAPYELSDTYIIHYMKDYGEVIEHSMRRGKVRGTDIETGTRYLQMVNVKNNIPIKVKLGRFAVRVFTDNKTECKICSKVGHPFYRCPDKDEPRPVVCSRCKCEGHVFKDCPNEMICNFCSEPGHKEKDCERYKASQQFGVYAGDIVEGRSADLDQSTGDQSHDDSHEEPLDNIRKNLGDDLQSGTLSNVAYEINNETEQHTNNLTNDDKTDEQQCEPKPTESTTTDDVLPTTVQPRETTLDRLSKERIFLVIGDSNAQRVHFKDPDVKTVTVSGGAAGNIDELLVKAETKVGETKVKRIAVHLGTNDISKHKSDSNQVILEITTAVNKIHNKFPTSEIAFSSIPNRKGKTQTITTLNNTTNVVNEFFQKMAKKESYLFFLNNDEDLMKDGVPISTMYDSNDIKGVHLSTKGASVLEENIQSFFDCGSEFGFDTPLSRKRHRSVMSNTPPSDKQSDKTKKLTFH